MSLKRLYKKWFADKPYAKKLLLAFIPICLIPVTIIGIYSCVSSIRSLETQVTASVNDTIDKSCDFWNYKMDSYTSAISELMYDNTFLTLILGDDTAMTPNESVSFLNDKYHQMQIAVPELTSMRIYCKNSSLRTDYLCNYEDIFSDPNLSSFNERNSFWWYRDNDGQLCLAYPIRDPAQNTKAGLFLLEIDPATLFSRFATLGTREYAVTVATAGNTGLYQVQNLTVPVAALPAYNEISDKTRVNIGNQLFMVTGRQIHNMNLTVCAFVPYRIVNEESKRILSILVTLWLASAIFVLLSATLISKNMVKRIRVLTHRMHEAQKGDIRRFDPDATNDEIGDISRTYVHTLEELDSMINTVYVSQIRQKEAEMNALVAQINPHFLYNILNTISWRAIMVNEPHISKVANNLSDFYRTTLNKGQSYITVRNELTNVKAYLELSLELHDDSFDVIYELEPINERYITVNLSLQPLVENAIKHGIDLMKSERGQIIVKAFETEDTLVFEITNNGPRNMENIDLNAFLVTDKGGYGLKNVNERIKLAFGDEYGIALKATGTWFTATIRIPKMTSEDIKQ